MKITSYAVARPAYYDRNASSVIQTELTVYAPHTATVRVTYTVAAGKKMFVETSSTLVQNVTAPTVAGISTSIVRLQNVSAQFTDPIRSDALTSAVLTTLIDKSLTGQTTLYAGEQALLITSNGSTGGTVLHLAAFKATLFDA